MQVHNVFDSILYTIKRTGFKALSSFIAVSSLVSMFGVTPVYAEESGSSDDLTATISGNTLGNDINSIRSTTTTCEGEQKLSDTDAEVFKKIVPESDGDIICAKSDGFRTEVTGTSDIKNFHWTAWYLKNKDDKPDTTNDIGNYHGFNASKVTAWKSHVDEIKGLNNGNFPEEKDYTYPVDTKENKINFWGDIAGYYNLLGDPQYKAIHLTSYQQFSYKTKHVVRRVEIVPPESTDNGSGVDVPQIGTKPQIGTEHPIEDPQCPEGYKLTKKGTCKKIIHHDNPCRKTKYKTIEIMGKKYTTAVTDCGGYNQYFAGSVLGATMPQIDLETDAYSLSSNEILAKVVKTENSNDNLVDMSTADDGTVTKTYEDIVYSYETQEVKVAEADLSSGTYATEYAAIPRLALKAGAGSTSELKVNNNGFWKITPRYWTDKGTITVTNKSDMPYHYESELTAGAGVNNVNVYSNLGQKDKLFSLIHGYPNITDINIPRIPGKPGFPSDQDETCVEVDNDAVCSKKQTPIILIEVLLDGDNPQQLEKADKTVHLVKNQETQDAIKDAKNK